MNSAARRAKCLPCPPQNQPPARRSPKPRCKAGDHLILVDGSGFIFRAFHALPPLTRKSDGLPIERRARLLQHGLEDAAGRADAASRATSPRTSPSSSTIRPRRFRREIYPDYKAHRPEPPSDLIPQFGLIRQATRAFNLACLEQEGWEADDLIATYAAAGERARRLRHHRLLRQGPDAARAARRARWSTR